MCVWLGSGAVAAQGVLGLPSLEVLLNHGDVPLRDVGMVGVSWGSRRSFPTLLNMQAVVPTSCLGFLGSRDGA